MCIRHTRLDSTCCPVRQSYAATIAGIPLLIAEPESIEGPHPVVFWNHGFRADALAHAREL